MPDKAGGATGRIAVREQFARFVAQAGCDPSPLYNRLALLVAGDDELLAIAANAQPGQPVPNLFLAAVQYLLFKDAGHPIAAYYPSINAEPVDGGELDFHFRDFVFSKRDEIEELLKSRLVQTNEVRRSACLLPGILRACNLGRQRPLYLIEVGHSAGLNLLFDKYCFDYGNGQQIGSPQSKVKINCQARGHGKIPLPAEFPAVAQRVGLDLHPIEASNHDSLLWLKALIWPEHEIRRRLLEAAIEIAKSSPIRHVTGDLVARLPELLAEIPSDATACLFHSYVLNQLPEDSARLFEETLINYSRQRELFCVYIPWKGYDGADLTLAHFKNGQKQESLLAKCSDHGTWIQWLT